MVYSLCISGTIAAGKSTVHDELKRRFKDDNRVVFCDEPIKILEQIKMQDGSTLFQAFVNQLGERKSNVNFAMIFQHRMMTERCMDIAKALQNPNVQVIVMERSITDDLMVFCSTLQDDGHLVQDEINTIKSWWPIFLQLTDGNCAATEYVLISTSVDTCIERIKKRGRENESYSVPYLEKLEAKHLDLAKNVSIAMTFDNNVERDSVEWENHMNNICKLISSNLQ